MSRNPWNNALIGSIRSFSLLCLFSNTWPLAAASDTATNLEARATRVVRAHDPSTLVNCKDEFWVFCTGPGIPSYHSTDLREWSPGPRVWSNNPAWFATAVPEHKGRDCWAPDITHLGDRYLLYYSVSTWGKNTSAIALATNPTLDTNDSRFQWSDQGIVVQSRATNDFNTIDPAICPDGSKLWLAFGSFWTGIKLIELDPVTGKRISPDSPMYSLAHKDKIEASYIYPHDGSYFLFLNWGQCCQGVRSTYNIRVGRAAKITGPYFDKDGVDMMAGGGSLFLQTDGDFIGPGHAGIIVDGTNNWFSCHFYDGTRNGRPTLGILPLTWAADGWPQIQ